MMDIGKVILFLFIFFLLIYILFKTNLSGFTSGFGDIATGIGGQIK